MGGTQDRKGGEGRGSFPSTRWSKLLAAGSADEGERRSALDFLIRSYWKPVYCYLRRSGFPEEAAKDLVQEFFTFCISEEVFAKADASRGRFRGLLLASLRHFVANVLRSERAQKRQPGLGLVSLAEPRDSETPGAQPAHHETPEAIFHRAWVADLARRVLRLLEAECQATGKQTHYEVFRHRLVLPALEGAEPPPLSQLATRLGMTPKQAANCLLTARRVFQRLLREEIATYATSEEDLQEELLDLLSFLGER